MALNTEALKNKQLENSAQNLQPHPAHPAAPTRPQQTSNEPGLRSEVTAGLANVLTHQAQQTMGLIQDAEQFTDKAAKALAQKAHKLASGEAFTEKFVGELNRLCAENPFDGFETLDWSEANQLLAELGKPALPAPKPNFLPDATR
ncbi:MAG TPA: hypothetical protein V6D29_01370 [Leptolyngbyaceae cyanobacterium]